MSTQTIENLMKVSLRLICDGNLGGDGSASTFVFVYGIGPSGITPFEKALFGKGVGDRLQMDIPNNKSCETLGHLHQAFVEQTGCHGRQILSITVNDVIRAKDREVVSAMASGGSCADCGCGCGGH